MANALELFTELEHIKREGDAYYVVNKQIERAEGILRDFLDVPEVALGYRIIRQDRVAIPRDSNSPLVLVDRKIFETALGLHYQFFGTGSENQARGLFSFMEKMREHDVPQQAGWSYEPGVINSPLWLAYRPVTGGTSQVSMMQWSLGRNSDGYDNLLNALGEQQNG